MASEKPDAFQVGAFQVAKNPDVRTFVEKLNRLREAVDQCRLQDGVGYTVSRSSGGTTLTIRGGRGGGAAPEAGHPWKVSFEFDTQSKSYGFRTEEESRLEAYYTSTAPAVRGIGQFVSISTQPLQETWFAVLTLRYDENLQITQAFLEGTAKSRFQGVIFPATGQQSSSHTILAKIKKDGTVIQGVRGDLYTALVNRQGHPCLLPVAFLDYPDLSRPEA